MMIEVRGLSRNFGEVAAVRKADFSVGRGEIAGLLGPNGAGKTTILRLLSGILRPHDGTVHVAEKEVSAHPRAVKALIGYLPENAPVYEELNVAEHLEFLAGSRGLSGAEKRRAMERVSEECGLTGALYRPLGLLSRGYRQRAALAGALIHRPPVLLLDEPTTGLDPRQIHEFRELIRRLGGEHTVLLSTHVLQEAEALCSRVMILSRGAIVAEGSPGEISAASPGTICYRVAVKGIAPEELERKAAGLSGYRPAARARSLERGSELDLCTGETQADGSEIFSWAVREGLELLSFYPRQRSLEDLFLRVLGNEDKEEER